MAVLATFVAVFVAWVVVMAIVYSTLGVEEDDPWIFLLALPLAYTIPCVIMYEDSVRGNDLDPTGTRLHGILTLPDQIAALGGPEQLARHGLKVEGGLLVNIR